MYNKNKLNPDAVFVSFIIIPFFIYIKMVVLKCLSFLVIRKLVLH